MNIRLGYVAMNNVKIIGVEKFPDSDRIYIKIERDESKGEIDLTPSELAQIRKGLFNE